MTEIFDCDAIIIGGGPAGMSAGIYAARGNLKTAVLDASMFGGQPVNYGEIENYPGFSLIGGFELAEKFEEHLDKFGVQKFPYAEITEVDLLSDIKTVKTDDKIFRANSVIIATGAHAKKLGIKGENEFVGRGVSYCAVCDAAFYKDKTVCVVGGGNSALEEACYLTKFAKKVFIVHRRDEFRADKVVIEKMLSNPKIECVLNCVPVEICGNSVVEKIVLKNKNNDEILELPTDGVFPYIGLEPETALFGGVLDTDEKGFLKTDSNMQTSVPGVFAAGDVRNTPLRQVITAAADGAVAACSCVKYVDAVKNKVPVV